MLANIFGDWYWLVLVVIVLFGGSQLPKLGAQQRRGAQRVQEGPR